MVVIGLDGATLELIEPWAKESLLPNLAQIMAEGAYGELRSTIPAVTAPAWTSFATGKNPGKHSIYDFVTLDAGTGRLTYSNSEHCQGEPLWDILSRHGKRVCVMNVPMTYPPRPVNGTMVTGMMTPGLDSEFVFPASLQKELRERHPDYMISAAADKDMADYPNSLKRMVEARAQLAQDLLSREPWDFFMMVFTATDLVQHMFWRPMLEEGHPQQQAILEVYQLIDAKIGEIRDSLEEGTHLLLMSDHGAGPIKKQVHINRWLEENGYLGYCVPDESWRQRLLKRLSVKAFIFWRTQIPLSLRTRIRNLSPKVQNMGVSEKIEAMASVPFDWSQTRAYHAGTHACIRINLKEREEGGIVESGETYEQLRDELIERFEALTDPETGEPVVDRVYKREDVYSGPALEHAPDLLIQWAGEAYWSDARFGKQSRQIFEDKYKVPLLTTAISAIHKRNGIFMAIGAGVEPQRVQDADITDVTPTILYALDLPLVADMDGKPLTEIFAPTFQKTRELRFEDASEVKRNDTQNVFSEEDRKKVEERLKDLGYLG